MSFDTVLTKTSETLFLCVPILNNLIPAVNNIEKKYKIASDQIIFIIILLVLSHAVYVCVLPIIFHNTNKERQNR